jgi:hypothetical protein
MDVRARQEASPGVDLDRFLNGQAAIAAQPIAEAVARLEQEGGSFPKSFLSFPKT